MLRTIATLVVMGLCLLPAPGLADDIDEAANAAQTDAWLSEAAARYRTGEYKGLPLYTAQIEEELPSAAEYEERSGWCSYYCCAPEILLSASSELAPSGELSYAAANLDDFELATAWVEGADDNGIGESISFTIRSKGDPLYAIQYINGLDLVNGYVKNTDVFQANACPVLLRLWFDGEAVCCLRLLDSRDLQTVEFAPLHLSDTADHVLRLEIVEVRSGSRFTDTAMTDIQLRGGPCH